jgi:hypothetical protein
MTIRTAATLAAAFVLSASGAAQEPRRDGNWQVTMEMEMPGMPQRMPPMTMTQCVTKEDAADPAKALPQGRGGPPNNCKVTDQKIDGNKVTWSMKCAPPEEMSGTGEFVYGADSYTGVMKMNRQGQTMTMKYSAKRLGDCTK